MRRLNNVSPDFCCFLHDLLSFSLFHHRALPILDALRDRSLMDQQVTSSNARFWLEWYLLSSRLRNLLLFDRHRDLERASSLSRSKSRLGWRMSRGQIGFESCMPHSVFQIFLICARASSNGILDSFPATGTPSYHADHRSCSTSLDRPKLHFLWRQIVVHADLDF